MTSGAKKVPPCIKHRHQTFFCFSIQPLLLNCSPPNNNSNRYSHQPIRQPWHQNQPLNYSTSSARQPSPNPPSASSPLSLVPHKQPPAQSSPPPPQPAASPTQSPAHPHHLEKTSPPKNPPPPSPPPAKATAPNTKARPFTSSPSPASPAATARTTTSRSRRTTTGLPSSRVRVVGIDMS